MRLIQDLGNIPVISKTGNAKQRKMGLFECPVCKVNIQKCIYNGARSETCGSKQCAPSKSFRHGYVGKGIYNSWAGMKARCDNPNIRSYRYYGEKGIGYPEKWKAFKGFLEDMLDGWYEGLEIDRIDSAKSYSKDNCRWLGKTRNRARVTEKAIGKYTLQGVFIVAYSSAAEAKRAGECMNTSSITRVARGDRKQYKGYMWKYLN